MFTFERRWAHAVLEGFAPPEGSGLVPDPGEVDYVAGYQQFVRGSTPRAALGARLALWIAALGPQWKWRKLQGISGFGPQERSALVQQLLGHRSFVVRELSLMLKTIASMSLMAAPEVRAQSNYDRDVTPPWGPWQGVAEVKESGSRRKLDVLGGADAEAG